MSRNCLTKPTRTIAGLLTGLLFAILAVPLGAQPAPESRVGHGFGPLYDAAHETTLHWTIQEVVTKHAVGSPAGMHLLVAGPQGVVDAHVGPFLSKETKEALQTGTPVRIVGAMASLHGKNYLLARELTVGGTTVTVRSEHGFCVCTPLARSIPEPKRHPSLNSRRCTMTFRKSILLLISLSMIAALVACSSSAPPHHGHTEHRSEPLTVNSQTSITATVSNDSANGGVTWSCSGGHPLRHV